MANVGLLYDTYNNGILPYLSQWDQRRYIEGEYVMADGIEGCGTSQCLAGIRCLMDGLKPVRYDLACRQRNHDKLERLVDGIIFVDPSDGTEVYAGHYARDRFELSLAQEIILFDPHIATPEEMKRHIDAIAKAESESI